MFLILPKLPLFHTVLFKKIKSKFPKFPKLPLFHRLVYLKNTYIPNVTVVTEIPDAFHFHLSCREKSMFLILPKLPLFHTVLFKKIKSKFPKFPKLPLFHRLVYLKNTYIPNVTVVTEIPGSFRFHLLCREKVNVPNVTKITVIPHCSIFNQKDPNSHNNRNYHYSIGLFI